MTTLSERDTAASQLAAPDAIALAEAEFVRRKAREAWRRRLLPAAGVLATLAIWAGLVYVYKVPPFIAPSPVLVATTLVQKFGLLMTNLARHVLAALADGSGGTA